MAKILLKKDLVLINFKKNAFKFYDIEVISVGYNNIHVISTYGKLGNKGQMTMNKYQDFQEAMKAAYKKIYDKKSEGFINKEHMIGWLGQSEENKTKKYSKKDNKENVIVNYKCSDCGNEINKSTYEKINKWARGEGNWDYRGSNFHNKVLCIDCQFKHEIFQKRLGEK